jgi:hypothetical protein
MFSFGNLKEDNITVTVEILASGNHTFSNCDVGLKVRTSVQQSSNRAAVQRLLLRTLHLQSFCFTL